MINKIYGEGDKSLTITMLSCSNCCSGRIDYDFSGARVPEAECWIYIDAVGL